MILQRVYVYNTKHVPIHVHMYAYVRVYVHTCVYAIIYVCISCIHTHTYHIANLGKTVGKIQYAQSMSLGPSHCALVAVDAGILGFGDSPVEGR